jgi:hypothetical protein
MAKAKAPPPAAKAKAKPPQAKPPPEAKAPPEAKSQPEAPPPQAKPRRQPSEKRVRDRIAASIPGSRTEVACSSGFVDIVTPTEIIEVKRASLWKAALGQVLAYGQDFPDKKLRVHLYDHDPLRFALAARTCETFGVTVTSSLRDVGPGFRVLRFVECPVPGAVPEPDPAT